MTVGAARERLVGSFDRHVHPDEPDRPDRRDASADRPGPPRETEAQMAERLGLSGLTRAAAYESLHARAQAQDAPFRERLAREEQEKPAERREPLSEPADSPSPQDPPEPPTDRPERNLEATRNYWTEVPRFLALWRLHTEKWFGTWYMNSNPESGKRRYDVSSDRRVGAADAVAKLPGAEPPISDIVKQAERENPHRGWLAGFEYRTKGKDRLIEKSLESLEAQPGATPEEAVSHIPDAIRYTFCFKRDDYVSGFRDVKERLESQGYEMYYARNTWSDAEYKGVNTRWVTPDGQRFELQFHTPESFHAKHEVTHQAYERIRDPRTTRTERDDLHEFQREVSSWIPVPGQATEIPDYKKEGF